MAKGRRAESEGGPSTAVLQLGRDKPANHNRNRSKRAKLNGGKARKDRWYVSDRKSPPLIRASHKKERGPTFWFQIENSVGGTVERRRGQECPAKLSGEGKKD